MLLHCAFEYLLWCRSHSCHPFTFGALLLLIQAYLTTFLPSGTYTVSDTLNMTQPGKMFLTTVGTPYCNNMAEVWGGNRSQIEHCGRTAPAELQVCTQSAASCSPHTRHFQFRIHQQHDVNFQIHLIHSQYEFSPLATRPQFPDVLSITVATTILRASRRGSLSIPRAPLGTGLSKR